MQHKKSLRLARSLVGVHSVACLHIFGRDVLAQLPQSMLFLLCFPEICDHIKVGEQAHKAAHVKQQENQRCTRISTIVVDS